MPIRQDKACDRVKEQVSMQLLLIFTNVARRLFLSGSLDLDDTMGHQPSVHVIGPSPLRGIVV